MRSRTRMLERRVPVIVGRQRDCDRVTSLNHDVDVSTLGSRVIHPAGVIVHGIELRRFIAGANPVKPLILRGCESRERKQKDSEPVQSLHNAPGLLKRLAHTSNNCIRAVGVTLVTAVSAGQAEVKDCETWAENRSQPEPYR